MKRRVLNTIRLLSIAIMVITGICILGILLKDYRSVRYWERIRELKNVDEDCNETDILPSLQSLYRENKDLIGWIKIDEGHIDYPVLQTKDDPEYYLRRNFDGEEYSKGVPFADFRCDVVPYQGFNTIIYGHYTNSDDCFRWLLNYSYKKWYEEHKYIKFDTLFEEGTYEIVAAFYLDGTDAMLLEEKDWDENEAGAFEIYNYLSIHSVKDFHIFRDKLKASSRYDADRELTMDNPIITLICCAPPEFSHIEENGRFVVVAQKIDKK